MYHRTRGKFRCTRPSDWRAWPQRVGASLFDQGGEKSGAHLQLGHLFARRYQPVFRYAFVQNGSKTETETALGFSVYFFKHNVKWQTAVAQLAVREDNQSRADYRIRSQLQLGF